jgi:hypothetical protein
MLRSESDFVLHPREPLLTLSLSSIRFHSSAVNQKTTNVSVAPCASRRRIELRSPAFMCMASICQGRRKSWEPAPGPDIIAPAYEREPIVNRQHATLSRSRPDQTSLCRIEIASRTAHMASVARLALIGEQTY